jgi:putative phosphotransacetylase
MSDSREATIALLMAGLGAASALAPDSGAIPVGVSNRHLHLSQADLAALFGPGYRLTEMKALSQPGQYAAVETVALAGPKGAFQKVRVLGPVRPSSQVEISRSDAFALGIKPPVRLSGDLSGAADIAVIGPFGTLVMKNTVIVAQRHIHITPADARLFGVSDGDMVAVEVGAARRAVFHETAVRVSAAAALELHLDTDEANAAGVSGQTTARLL